MRLKKQSHSRLKWDFDCRLLPKIQWGKTLPPSTNHFPLLKAQGGNPGLGKEAGFKV